MKFDPDLTILLTKPWNNNACRGYVIYAMENCGFSSNAIRCVVAELHEVFDFFGLEAQQHFGMAPIDFGTNCPKVEQEKRAIP